MRPISQRILFLFAYRKNKNFMFQQKFPSVTRLVRFRRAQKCSGKKMKFSSESWRRMVTK